MGLYTNYCVLKTYGLDESKFKKAASEFNNLGIEISYEENFGVGKIFVINDNGDDIIFQEVVVKLSNYFAEYIYDDKDLSLESVAVRKLLEKGYTISVAESITAGLITSKIASIPGASRVLYEGIVAYDARAKVRRLHVSSKTIEKKGAVSKETISEMLDGLLSNKEISFAIATTGIAGPGSCDDMPQGLAFIGVASRKYGKNIVKKIFDGNRNDIRETVANYAIFMLIKELDKYKNF